MSANIKGKHRKGKLPVFLRMFMFCRHIFEEGDSKVTAVMEAHVSICVHTSVCTCVCVVGVF